MGGSASGLKVETRSRGFSEISEDNGADEGESLVVRGRDSAERRRERRGGGEEREL